MNYLAGYDVTLNIDLFDDAGNAIVANSVLYKVSNQLGEVIIPNTSLTGLVAGDVSISITIPAADNFLPVTNDVSSLRSLRFVEIYITTPVGLVKKEVDYIIESDNVLALGINSFQSYPSALYVAGTIDNIDAFYSASKADKIIALIRARQIIGRLSFRYGFDNFDNVNRSIHSREITLATQVQFEAYPKDFKDALARAQVIQANDLLGGDEEDELRSSGLTSVQVGEAKQTFRQSKPIETIVSRRTMKELSKFINYTLRVSR